MGMFYIKMENSYVKLMRRQDVFWYTAPEFP